VVQVEVCVAAVDKGQPTPLSSTVTVTLNIVDVNDCAPRFTQSSYTFGTYENQPADTEIGRLVAVDADSAPHDRFVFTVVAETPPIGVFVVDRRSGRLATARELDRELTRVHHILVAATDIAKPQLSSTVNVTVFVADRNDNAPVISFPRPGNDSVEVRDDVMSGFFQCILTAKCAASVQLPKRYVESWSNSFSRCCNQGSMNANRQMR